MKFMSLVIEERGYGLMSFNLGMIGEGEVDWHVHKSHTKQSHDL